MKFKKFFASTVSILTLCSVIAYSPINKNISYAANNDYYQKAIYNDVVGTSVTNGYELNIDNYPCLRGQNNEKIKVTFKNNFKGTSSTTSAIALRIANVAPNLNNGANVNVGAEVINVNSKEFGNEVSYEFFISEVLSKAIHKSTTGVAGTSAVSDVHKFVIYASACKYALDNKVKIEVLTPYEEEPTPTPKLDCSVKYQLRGNNPYDVRFIGEVDAEQIEKAESATATVSKAVNDDPDHFTDVETTTITKAYKSIIANGQKQEAPEGKYFLISAVASDLTDGDKAKAVFSLDGASGESDRTVVIGNVPESSSEEESSSEPEESSSEAEDSSSNTDDSSETDSNVIWKGSENLGNWDTDVDLGVTGIPQAKKDGILTIEYTSVTGAAQIQVINKIGEKFTWTPMKTADGNEYFDATGGKLQIKLTEEQASQLVESKGMFLKGKNATVTKITYVGSGENAGKTEVIWTGSQDLGNWNKDVDLGVAGIPLAEKDGILTVEYTSAGAAQISVINKIGAAWTWTPMKNAEGNEYFDTAGGKLQIKLTEEQASQLASSKAMFLKGKNATVTKITYKTPGGKSETEVIWTGSEDLGNWNKDIDLGVANIPLAEEGGILTIKYTASGAAQISVINKVGAAWTWTPMKNAEGNEFFDTTGGKLDIKLTAEQAEQLVASKAMFLKGQNATVTEITYTSK